MVKDYVHLRRLRQREMFVVLEPPSARRSPQPATQVGYDVAAVATPSKSLLGRLCKRPCADGFARQRASSDAELPRYPPRHQAALP